MKIAYLIVAHNNPLVLERLINRLDSGNAKFYIHIDKKAEIETFKKLQRDNVIFCRSRLAVYWGDFSLVEVCLLLIRYALNQNFETEYLVLLSGSHYPIQPVEYIEDYFFENTGAEFISMVEMQSVSDSKPLTRLTTYYLRDNEGRLKKAIQKLKVFAGILPKERDYLPVFNNMLPYAGSNWWAITASAGAYILDFVNNNQKFVDFYKNTDCPDESFFHTIIGNSPYKINVRGNITYTDWSAGGANPANINDQHLSLFTGESKLLNTRINQKSSELLFARKFSDHSLSLLDKIDHALDKKNRINSH